MLGRDISKTGHHPPLSFLSHLTMWKFSRKIGVKKFLFWVVCLISAMTFCSGNPKPAIFSGKLAVWVLGA